MYPELTRPLVVLVAAAVVAMAAVALARPFLRRLAQRQLSRRPTEAVLVIAGSLLGTAIIVGSLAVGDTLNHSVKATAFRTLGPVDEEVLSDSPVRGAEAAARLATLRDAPDVDGLLTVLADRAAVSRGVGAALVAEPQAMVVEADLRAAAVFGGRGASGPEGSHLAGQTPAAGGAVVNADLAGPLGLRPGDAITAYLYGRATPLRVERVVPAEGLAALGISSGANRDLFVAPGTLAAAAARAGSPATPTTISLISNRGGVESGSRLTGVVEAKIRAALGGLTSTGAQVTTPKKDALATATQLADQLGSLFLFIGSFSIIAGLLLLVNVFVMLTDERRGQLGMLRAMGMRRRRLVGSFLLEGSVYGVLAAALGVAAGIGVGAAVVLVAGRIFAAFQDGPNALDLTFAVTPTSLVNGFAAGFLIAFVTIAATSARVSRLNIIAAIRDLPDGIGRRPRRWRLVACGVLCAAFVASSVPAIANAAGVTTYLYPALAVAFAIPLLLRVASQRMVATGASAAVLAWALVANLVRPGLYDDGSTTTYIVLGVLITATAVIILSANQDVVLRPLRPLIERPGEAGLATRLAVTYPVSRKFRTGSTLLMYALIIFTLVLIAQIGAIIGASTDKAVAEASAGYSIRVDFSGSNPVTDPTTTLRSGDLARQVAEVAPLTIGRGTADDPAGRTHEPLPVVAVGWPASARPLALDSWLPALGTDSPTAWRAILADPRYVVLDPFYDSTTGPQGNAIKPGATLTLTDPATGRTAHKTVGAIVRSAIPFYTFPGQPAGYPVFAGVATVRAFYGDSAKVTSALVRAAPGEEEDRLAATLQGRFLTNGLVSNRTEYDVRRTFAANVAFFRLMQGYLALGLFVGITGLGVVMVRAVRERRRTIGILRALGVRSRTVMAAFLGESAFVAVEGIVAGTGLSLLTAWLMFSNNPMFRGLDISFPIAWATILPTMAATLVASLLASAGPARRAAAISPAVAVRVAD
ncbi:ABC transporter permease [Frankia sp. AgB1.9]|uniref:ABC transporter permease n=1 Tax=unclassified Frankia TaxID=2632575 RepID=UPI001932AFE9|nr:MULTISPECIES: ABC transporter permease [unclassified Frankia]MBL7549447.1 ABC transporter permease [Frankia sp. AgB1.9]MBL7619937.1 ABC transporter permease [Frankia sp. AgB1.8]